MQDRYKTDKRSRQLKNTVQQLEHELDLLYLQTGKRMLETAEQTSRKANALAERMIAAKKLLASSQDQARCPSCLTLNPSKSHYCGCCGTKLNEERKTL